MGDGQAPQDGGGEGSHRHGNVGGKGDMHAQLRQVGENIKAAPLGHYGGIAGERAIEQRRGPVLSWSRSNAPPWATHQLTSTIRAGREHFWSPRLAKRAFVATNVHLITRWQTVPTLREGEGTRSIAPHMPRAGTLASERAKEGADVLGQQLWLFKRRKMTTPGHHRPLLEVIEAFGPLPRWLADFVRKAGHGTGHIDALSGLENPGVVLVLVVQPGGRVNGLGDPVDGDGGEQFVLGEAPFHLPTAVAPGTPLLDNPGGQARWGVIQPVGQGLGFGALDMGISALFQLPMRTRFQERALGDRQFAHARLPARGCSGHRGRVNANDLTGVGKTQAGRYSRAPVAALGAVAPIA